MRSERIAALTGVAFVVVVIIGGIIAGDPPDAESPVQEIVDHYADNKTSIQVSAFVGAAAMVLLVFFGAYLRSVLSAAEEIHRFLGGGPILSLPTHGRSTSGTTTLPSACWQFSRIATSARVHATAVPLSVWTLTFFPFLSFGRYRIFSRRAW